jgi:membrane protein implicated in regulation of membrane protease activity
MIELTVHRPRSTGLRPSVILLLTPLWVLITVAILLGLLGIFVLWLAVVGALISAIVATDLGQRFAARLARPPVGTLRHRPVGYPGR